MQHPPGPPRLPGAGGPPGGVPRPPVGFTAQQGVQNVPNPTLGGPPGRPPHLTTAPGVPSPSMRAGGSFQQRPSPRIGGTPGGNRPTGIPRGPPNMPPLLNTGGTPTFRGGNTANTPTFRNGPPGSGPPTPFRNGPPPSLGNRPPTSVPTGLPNAHMGAGHARTPHSRPSPRLGGAPPSLPGGGPPSLNRPPSNVPPSVNRFPPNTVPTPSGPGVPGVPGSMARVGGPPPMLNSTMGRTGPPAPRPGPPQIVGASTGPPSLRPPNQPPALKNPTQSQQPPPHMANQPQARPGNRPPPGVVRPPLPGPSLQGAQHTNPQQQGSGNNGNIPRFNPNGRPVPAPLSVPTPKNAGSAVPTPVLQQGPPVGTSGDQGFPRNQVGARAQNAMGGGHHGQQQHPQQSQQGTAQPGPAHGSHLQTPNMRQAQHATSFDQVPPPQQTPSPQYPPPAGYQTYREQPPAGSTAGVGAGARNPWAPQGFNKSRRGSLGARADHINPSQIPRPTHTEYKVYKTRCGDPPPPVMTPYSVVDEGNCSPKFVRSTCYAAPATQELVERIGVSLGVVVRPFAPLGPEEDEIKVADHPRECPLRCGKCNAYMNPFMRFVDNGRYFMCNMCGQKNTVPDWYECNLDEHGKRRDRYERPELSRGSVEYLVDPEKMPKELRLPNFVFCIDVSYNAVLSGALRTTLEAARDAIDKLSDNEYARVGLICYDSKLMFFPGYGSQWVPRMVVITDVDDVFVPVPRTQLMASPADDTQLEYLLSVLDLIQETFTPEAVTQTLQRERGMYKVRDPGQPNTPTPHSGTPATPNDSKEQNRLLQSTSTVPLCLGAAIMTAHEVLKDVGGKVAVLATSLPSIGMGQLMPREKAELYFTPQESTLFTPQNDFYVELATQCARDAVNIDFFLCSAGYIDVATLSLLSRKTGGQVNFYPGFQRSHHGTALFSDFVRTMTRHTGWNCIMVVRCSKGMVVDDAFGHFFCKQRGAYHLAALDCDRTFAFTFKHTRELKSDEEVCLQCAVLYSDPHGQQRIRVHTLSLAVSANMTVLFRKMDSESLVNISFKRAIVQLNNEFNYQSLVKSFVGGVVDALYAYRKYVASYSSSGKLIIPESLRFFPLYVLAMVKNIALQPGTSADMRSYLFSYVRTMPMKGTNAMICPHMYSLLDLPHINKMIDQNGHPILPSTVLLSNTQLKPDGIYLLDDSISLYLWIGDQVGETILNHLFESRNPHVFRKSADRNDIVFRINVFLQLLRQENCLYPVLSVVQRTQPGEQKNSAMPVETVDESRFYAKLVEDGAAREVNKRGRKRNYALLTRPPETLSYVDFLVYVHKSIQKAFLER